MKKRTSWKEWAMASTALALMIIGVILLLIGSAGAFVYSWMSPELTNMQIFLLFWWVDLVGAIMVAVGSVMIESL